MGKDKISPKGRCSPNEDFRGQRLAIVKTGGAKGGGSFLNMPEKAVAVMLLLKRPSLDEIGLNGPNVMETEISRIRSEIVTMSLEKEELKNDLKKLSTEVNKQDATLMSLEKEVEILRDIHKELKDLYDKESRILNEEVVETDLETLEKSIEEAKEKLTETEENLKNVKLLKEKLREEPECGDEFISLQVYLKQAQMEVETLEKQYEEAKHDHWYNSRNKAQLTFLPEPLMVSCPTTNTSSHHGVCESLPFHDNKQMSWELMQIQAII
ncbi:uncharacterized protein [Hetaerina americana]|uniref:uncharacterized protein n=1 Tax=Hetaerina americana TaxID=62018 RepID=UPI003A7F21BB